MDDKCGDWNDGGTGRVGDRATDRATDDASDRATDDAGGDVVEGGIDARARGCTGAPVRATHPFDLFDVYGAIVRRADRGMDALQRRGFEIALDKICSRIARDGASAVRFETEAGVFAYAKRAVSSSVRDARRRVDVEIRHRTSVRPWTGSPCEAEDDAQCTELGEWLVGSVGSDDARLLYAVHVEECSFAELARDWGAKEQTLRARAKRAGERARQRSLSERDRSAGARARHAASATPGGRGPRPPAARA